MSGEMRTCAESAAIPLTKQLEMLKEAKGGSWYSDDWAPYCLSNNCHAFMGRMVRESYGFRCTQACGNKVGWDLMRLQESPLNSRQPILTP